MMNNIGLPGILLIAIVVLVLFGRGKISGLMGEVGKGITSFKKGISEGTKELDAEAKIVETETAETAKNWREIVHSLKGAARGVGAFKLGEIAAEAEKMRLSDNMEVLETVERLKTNAATVHQFIDDLISKSS